MTPPKVTANFFLSTCSTMSLASRAASQTLRSAIRRAPRAISVGAKPHAASYSLLAKAAAATKSAQRTQVRVHSLISLDFC